MPKRGGSKGRKKQTLRDFTRELPSAEDEKRFRKAMDADSDLVTAIVHAVELDYIIEQSIVSRLLRHDQETVDILAKENGALSTFFAKIGLGYAMGFYESDVMEYLNTIRRIRNAFAHSRKDISFARQQIRDELSNVKMPITEDEDLRNSVEIIKGLTGSTVSRSQYELALTGRAAYVLLCMNLVRLLLKQQNQYARARSEQFRRSMLADALAGSKTGEDIAEDSE